ncbi:MAG TPA: site-specific integrase [Syntrophomonadaceae bacterium]|nr:site-specific integrase [Syntrophomonadaceae bacterium]
MLGQFSDVADRTKKNFYATLKSALKRGYGWGFLSHDITQGIMVPKAEPVEKPILNFQELSLLLEVAKKYKHHLILRLLIVTGARLGEVLGLRWCDIDFETGKINIVKSVDSHDRILKDRVKTKSSRRVTILDKETLKYLKHKQQTDKVVAINKNERLIFLADDGRPMRHRAVELTFKRALKKLDCLKWGYIAYVIVF